MFTLDTINMYDNIGIYEGVSTIKKYIKKCTGEYKGHFPSKLIIKLLHLVVSKNIFQFVDTWWIHKVGTAMGTPHCNILCHHILYLL